MTKKDRITLLHFFSRTAMYIGVVEKRNIMSFLTGYEIGRRNKCKFLEETRNLLVKKYGIKYPNTGLEGQIENFSKKNKLSWIITFKRIALEVLTNQETIHSEMRKSLRTFIEMLVNRIGDPTNIWYDETWKDHWQFLISQDSTWLKKIMTKQELSIIFAINKEVMAGHMYKNTKEKVPTSILLNLKEQFENVKK